MSTTKFRTLIPMFEELRGERVIIRPYRESDAQDVFEAVGESRDHLHPWLPFANEHQTVEETRDWIIHQVAAWLLREDMTLGMWEAATHRYLGGTGFHPQVPRICEQRGPGEKNPESLRPRRVGKRFCAL